MNRIYIKGIFFTTLLLLCLFTWVQAQESNNIKLTQPTKKGGLTIMETFSIRASERSWADRELSSQDLSNLLWAANGINRSDSKKRTAPSAGNSQDVDIYVIMKSGVYLYDAANHALNLVSAGDHRSEIGRPMGGPRSSGGAPENPGNAPADAPGGPSAAQGGTPSAPPGGGTGARGGMPDRGAGGPAAGNSTAAVNLIMVSDRSKLRMGTEETKKETGIIDAALVSENISLFCAGNGLANVPRAGSISDKKDALKTLLKLKDTQYIVIENAVGYPVETK